jgi:transposase
MPHETQGIGRTARTPCDNPSSGRPKTDPLKDAQWIARLAEMGLLRPSFVPPPEIRALRDLTRTRLQLVKDRTREWQRLEKLLEGALIKLSSAVYSLARNKTARDILEAILAGERDPKVLAARTHGNIKGGSAVIEQALEGMLLGEHHPVLIRLHMDHITLLDRLAAGIDDEIEAALDAVPAAWGVAADGVPSPGPGTGCRGAARSGAARGDSWRQPQARPGDHRRDGPGHDPVPDRGSPGVLGRAGAGRPAVRPAAAQTLQGARRRLPQDVLRSGR